MKTIKVSEASGAALDWLVAKCEEHPSRCPWMLEQEGFIEWQAYEHAWGNPIPSYSTDWSRGGPLINQMLVEGLQLKRNEYPRGEGTEFVASLPTPARFNFGPTPLLAALRCYVVSKLGETVEVPEDL